MVFGYQSPKNSNAPKFVWFEFRVQMLEEFEGLLVDDP